MSAASTSTDPNTQNITNLVQMGLYFYIQSYKYINYIGHFSIFQFQTLLKFFFSLSVRLIPMDARPDLIPKSNQISLTLDNQNNTVWG